MVDPNFVVDFDALEVTACDETLSARHPDYDIGQAGVSVFKKPHFLLGYDDDHNIVAINLPLSSYTEGKLEHYDDKVFFYDKSSGDSLTLGELVVTLFDL